ncbi:protein disulfide isomerase [Wallemia mellicola]|uniref:Protein disulfide-isomerase n=1 Tax=Wallemia mellicola TaxID=1708541 RepID=A0A4T0SQI0_9BASI|nr:hypothetical protein E3Q24_03322 [Wallemia mellicola]TIB72307.1 hypothetical protein E3Q23_03434 [Wallemia mellicola]TIB76721.1 protein disulfide isomerase [Wallemia mellicola]TIB82322.1 protein disulfide isomerase [Wallemia mellicola]TIB85153.1 protein disulfide isomerase [Wallemia mellicola]
MKLKASVAAGLLAFLASVHANENNEPSDVVSLTKDTFSDFVNSDLSLLSFTAPWCGHCNRLKPEYKSAASTLKSKDIPLGNVDCTEQAELCAEHEVGGYPTLKVFRKGLSTPYGGTRKADGIVSYMTKQSLPAVSSITPQNHDEFKQSDKVVVIAYNLKPNSDLYNTFHSTANTLRDKHLFGETEDSTVAKQAGVSGPSVVIYKSFDEGRNDVDTKSLDEKTLIDTISVNSVPLIDEVGPENFAHYATSGLPLAYLFVNPEDPKLESRVEELKPVAEEYKGKINFVWIDGVKFVEHGKALNLVKDEWPGFVIQDLVEGNKYPFDATKDVNKKNIASFVKDYSNGKIQPSIKSQPIPEERVVDGVYQLVADEYEKVALDDKKDSLVAFVAGWCGHCRALHPKYNELGQRFSGDDGVVIARFDATENDVPDNFSITSFPTIKLQPAGTKGWIDYEGDRSVEDLEEFLNKNRATKSSSQAEQKPAHDEHKKDEL